MELGEDGFVIIVWLFWRRFHNLVLRVGKSMLPGTFQLRDFEPGCLGVRRGASANDPGVALGAPLGPAMDWVWVSK